MVGTKRQYLIVNNESGVERKIRLDQAANQMRFVRALKSQSQRDKT